MDDTNKNIDLSHVLEREKNENKINESIIKSNSKTEHHSGNSRAASWMVRHSFGIIKNENQASVLLLIASIIVISFSVFLVFNSLYAPMPKIPQSINNVY
jgi:hypothetical protein